MDINRHNAQSPRILAKALLLSLLVGCQGPPSLVALDRGPKYRIEVSDDLARRRFNLELISEEIQPICVDFEGWPNQAGEVFQGSQRMSLDVPGHESIPGISFKFAVSCPGGCGYTVVTQGSPLKGFVGYDQFDNDDQWASVLGKKLSFQSSVDWCPSKQR